MTLNYKTYLKNKLKAAQSEKKSIRTKVKLEYATISTMSEFGYRGLTVDTISKKSDVSRGTFYLYYKNVSEVSLHALKGFIEFYLEALTVKSKADEEFEKLCVSTLQWIKVIKANKGLFRCILQASDEFPEITELMNKTNFDYYSRIAMRAHKNHGEKGKGELPALTMAAYALGSMMDEISRKLVSMPDKYFLEVVKQNTPSNEELAEFLSLLWYRALYGENPKGQKITAPSAKIIKAFNL